MRLHHVAVENGDACGVPFMLYCCQMCLSHRNSCLNRVEEAVLV